MSAPVPEKAKENNLELDPKGKKRNLELVQEQLLEGSPLSVHDAVYQFENALPSIWMVKMIIKGDKYD